MEGVPAFFADRASVSWADTSGALASLITARISARVASGCVSRVRPKITSASPSGDSAYSHTASSDSGAFVATREAAFSDRAAASAPCPFSRNHFATGNVFA